MQRITKSGMRAAMIAATLTACSVLVACSSNGGGQDTTTTQPTQTNVSACETTDLTASVAGTEAGTDQHAVKVRLLNTSGTPCSITGAPKVEVTGEENLFVSAPGSADGGSATLDAEGSAYFDISYPGGGKEQCAKGERLVITPPSQDATLLLPLTRDEIPQICRDSKVTVGAVTANPM